MNDIRRIRFVSARFSELQGFSVASFGAGLLAAALVDQCLTGSDDGALYTFHGVMVASLFWSAMQADLSRRYRATFGQAVGGTGVRDTSWVGGLPMFALMVGVMFDAMSAQYRSGPSVGSLGLALASMFLVARDGTWRLHYLVPVAAGLAGAYITSGTQLRHFGVMTTGDARTHAMIAAHALSGFGLLTAGLLDHRLLVGALAPRRSSASAPALARASGGRPRAVLAALICGCATLAWAGMSSGLAPVDVDIVLYAMLACVFCAASFWRLRKTRRAARRDAPPFTLDAADIVVLIGVALAMTLDTVLGAAGVPHATVAAFAAASAYIVVRDWPPRRHYSLGIVAASLVWILAPRVTPSAAVLLFVVAATAALTIENLLDARLAGSLAGAASPEEPHADTI